MTSKPLILLTRHLVPGVCKKRHVPIWFFCMHVLSCKKEKRAPRFFLVFVRPSVFGSDTQIDHTSKKCLQLLSFYIRPIEKKVT